MKTGIIAILTLTLLSCSNKSGYKDLTVSDFKKGLTEEVTLLDVRTQAEWNSGVIEGAVLINVFDSDFNKKIGDLDKSKPVYVYCKSGGRSSRAANSLSSNGFTNVYNLIGGITAWKKSGHKVVKP